MGRRNLGRFLGVLIGVLLGGFGILRAGDSDLATGVRQAQEGEYEKAVVTLDGVVRRLTDQPGAAGELTSAHIYLGVAHLGLGDQEEARSSFEKALRATPDLQLSREEYPPRVVRFFETVRGEQAAAAAIPPTVRPERFRNARLSTAWSFRSCRADDKREPFATPFVFFLSISFS